MGVCVCVCIIMHFWLLGTLCTNQLVRGDKLRGQALHASNTIQVLHPIITLAPKEHLEEDSSIDVTNPMIIHLHRRVNSSATDHEL